MNRIFCCSMAFVSFCFSPMVTRAADGTGLVGVIQHPIVESVLTAVILLSILAEIKTAGFSGGSVVAALAGCVLLGADWYAGDGEVIEFLLYFGGMALILLDLLLFMTGAMAAAGLVALLTGLFFTFGGGVTALYIIAAAICMAAVGMYFLASHLSKSPLWQKMTLSSQLTGKAGFVSSSQKLKAFEGKEGIALSVLRPAGKVKVDGTVLDALSSGDFIEKGETVQVQKAEASYVVVAKVN